MTAVLHPARLSASSCTRAEFAPIAAAIRATARRILAEIQPDPPAQIAVRRALLNTIGAYGRAAADEFDTLTAVRTANNHAHHPAPPAPKEPR